MSQIKIKDIEGRLEYLNKMLAKSKVKIHHSRRYNYNALDLYHDTGYSLIDTVVTGMTRSETYTYINAMIKGIELVTRKPN